jgi:organic hydroperoxide reductase OsmC/OhrA
MSGHVHRYRATCAWEGSTGAGYEGYGREHVGAAPPAEAEVRLSSDSAFRGDPARLNPEQLVVLAAASCQLLSFLALAARSRIDVVAYRDEAEAEMPEDDKPVRLTAIRLRPRITVAPGTDEARVRRLVERAHEACYVANSLRTEIAVEATVVVGARS